MIAVILIALTNGCSTATRNAITRPRLDLTKVERLAYGTAIGKDVRATLGDPDEVVQLKHIADQEIWIYNELKGQQSRQRLSLAFDKRTDVVLGATWSVHEDEPLSKENAALARFNQAKFSVEPAGQIARDYYSNDQIHTDERLGITMFQDDLSKNIQLISFVQPAQRSLSKNDR